MNTKTKIILFALCALAAEMAAQGSRIMLTQLERGQTVDGTRAGQIGLTNANGDQRYAHYVEVPLDTIDFIPAPSGNVSNFSEFVYDTLGGLWYIDWQGNAVEFGMPETCDTDFLQISDNSCPDALTDSLYKYRYLSVGARYVFPGAELLVNDSLSSGIAVVQGFRNARLALYDSNAGNFLMIDHGSNAPVVYMPVNANLVFKTTAGTPQTPIGSQVNHFGINAQDSTIQAFRYPNTRVDTQSVLNFLYTDPVGKVRSRDVAYLTDTLGFGANIYNSDGNILAGIERTVSLDSTAQLRFDYPNGEIGLEIHGGDDSTSSSGAFVRIKGKGGDPGTLYVETDFVSMVKGESYIEFGPNDPGVTVVIDGIAPEQGTILMSNVDGFFHFAKLDTFSGIVNIYNSNGVIENEIERVVIVDTLASLAFTTPVDGGDINLLSMFAGDGTGAGSEITIRAGTTESASRITIEQGNGVQGYWEDNTYFEISDNSSINRISQNHERAIIEGGDYTEYQLRMDTADGEIIISATTAGGETETSINMDTEVDGESFIIRTFNDGANKQAYVSGALATIAGVQTIISAYDANAPQYTINEIRIDTAGVGILTRGGVGNAGDVLHSNGEKTYWDSPQTAATIYNTSGTIEDPDRTVQVATDGYLHFLYDGAQGAIEIDDFGTIVMSSKDGETGILISDGIAINADGLTENIEINAGQGSVRIGASATVDLMPNGGGVVGIGTPGTPTQLFFADADGGGHGTYIVAGSQAANINWELPGVAGTDGQVLTATATDALVWEDPSPTIYSADDTFTGARTATLDAGEFLAISYSNAQPAIWAVDAASTAIYSPSGSNLVSVGDGQVLIDCQQSPQGVFTIQSDVTNIQATGGYVRIGSSNGYSPLALTDSSLTYVTTIHAGTQTGNATIVLPVDAPANGQVLRMKTASAGITEWGPALEDGVLSADQLSWSAGAGWETVNANRALFVQASGTITPSIGVTEIIVNDTATTSTVNLNYVPGDLDGASYAQPYTTVRYIYNWGSGDCTVDTNQDWLFRTQGNGAGQTTLTIPTGQSYKLVWVQGSTEANSRFWCFRLQ